MYFMSDPQALHVTRNVIPGKLGVDLHLHRVHIPLVQLVMLDCQCMLAVRGPRLTGRWAKKLSLTDRLFRLQWSIHDWESSL